MTFHLSSTPFKRHKCQTLASGCHGFKPLYRVVPGKKTHSSRPVCLFTLDQFPKGVDSTRMEQVNTDRSYVDGCVAAGGYHDNGGTRQHSGFSIRLLKSRSSSVDKLGFPNLNLQITIVLVAVGAAGKLQRCRKEKRPKEKKQNSEAGMAAAARRVHGRLQRAHADICETVIITRL